MAMQQTEIYDEPLSETPEDVAILYSWANLHGAKYRDFSASRREYRAQIRHRAAEETRLAELEAKAQAEAAAAHAEQVAREAERVARSAGALDGLVDRERALYEAEAAARRAAQERVEAARRAEAAAEAEAEARRQAREIVEAHVSAQRQAANWHDSEIRHRLLAGPQPVPAGSLDDPYEEPEHIFEPERTLETASAPVDVEYARRLVEEREMFAPRTSGERRAYRERLEVRRRPQGYRPDLESGWRPAYRNGSALVTPEWSSVGLPQNSAPAIVGTPYAGAISAAAIAASAVGPAWLYGESSKPHGESLKLIEASTKPVPPPAPVADTLQYSRERVAARWFALKGAFDPGQQPTAPPPVEPAPEPRLPLLGVFSLAGGVGKTSLLATLGRALSSVGEKVLLADTTSHGLLPFYFGASELRAGVVRTFSPPAGSLDAPIHLVSYDVGAATDLAAQTLLAESLVHNAAGTQRLLLDLAANSGWLLGRLSPLKPTVLVPLAPDMNSVLSLRAVERYLRAVGEAQGHPLRPYYVINQFDAALPLHLDVREVLRRQLGERLLPFVIRRSPAISEALAEGMTVIDYAPDAAVVTDYRNVASWLRSLAAPAGPVARNSRWSER
jgi:cellulose synthase operon protein YhjQ